MPERERERAIELEATSDRRYSLVVRTDGSVAVGQVRHLPQLPVIIAKAGIEAASPHSLASELIHSYEIGRHLAAHHHHDSALQAERERKLNQGLSLSF
jgi:hypothetical protein